MPPLLITQNVALGWAGLPPGMSFPPSALAAAVQAAETRGAASDSLRVGACRALLGANRFVEALALADRGPASAELATIAAQVLLALDRPDEALARLEDAARAPEGGNARRLGALTRLRRGDPRAQDEIAAIVDDQGGGLSWDLLAALQPARGWDWVLDLLDRTPHRFQPGEAPEIRIRALVGIGRGEDARALLDAGLLACQTLDVTDEGPGFPDLLRTEIAALDSFIVEPHDTATRGGRQTGFLLTGNVRALPRLLRRIQRAVEGYAAARRDHPGLSRRPARVQL